MVGCTESIANHDIAPWLRCESD